MCFFYLSFFLPWKVGAKGVSERKRVFAFFPPSASVGGGGGGVTWQSDKDSPGGSRGGGKRRRRRFLLLPSFPVLEKSKYVIQQCRKQDFEIVMLYNTISETCCILSVDISEYLLLENFGPCVSAFESLFLLPLSLLPLPSLPSFFFEK